MSRTFTTTSTPSTSPNATANTRRARGRSTSASASSSSPSSGIRTNAAGVSRLTSLGATRTNHTVRQAPTVATRPRTTRVPGHAVGHDGQLRGVALPPQPPHVPAERLGQQGQRDDERELA